MEKSMIKKHLEFYKLNLDEGWAVPPGYPPGVEQLILNGALDEVLKQGTRTRLLRFLPGAFTTEPFEHDYWEEVVLVSGDLSVQGDPFEPLTYACRPPFVPHGPFSSQKGCILLEIHYYL